MQPEPLLNVQEVADFLRINTATVYGWAQSGQLPAIKVGRSWRFRRVDLEAWLDRNRKDLEAAMVSTTPNLDVNSNDHTDECS